MRRAWHSWSQIRAQCVNKRVPLRARAKLLDAVVLPTLLWGLATISLTRAQRKLLTTLQRTMLQNAMRLPRRSEKVQEVYARRRERITTARIRDSMRSPWGCTQRFRNFMFLGHVARMDDSAGPHHPQMEGIAMVELVFHIAGSELEVRPAGAQLDKELPGTASGPSRRRWSRPSTCERQLCSQGGSHNSPAPHSAQRARITEAQHVRAVPSSCDAEAQAATHH